MKFFRTAIRFPSFSFVGKRRGIFRRSAALFFFAIFCLTIFEARPVSGQGPFAEWRKNASSRTNRQEKTSQQRVRPSAASSVQSSVSPVRSPSRPSSGSPSTSAAAPQTTSIEQLASASTSRQSLREAVESIPWNSLRPSDRELVETMIRNHTIYRRLPMAGGYCDPEIYDFLLCHPEIVTGLWQVMGYQDINLLTNGSGRYRVQEKSGTVADVSVLYHDNRTIILYCSGTYRGGVTRPLEGGALAILQFRFTEDAAKKNAPIAISRLDCFIQVKGAGVELISRVLEPFIGKMVDSNFLNTVDFVNQVSEAAEKNPEGLAQTVHQIASLSPETRDRFIVISERVADHRESRVHGKQVDYVLSPKANVPKVASARLLSRNDVSAVQAPTSDSIAQNVPHGYESAGANVEKTVFRGFSDQKLPAGEILPGDEVEEVITLDADTFDLSTQVDFFDRPSTPSGSFSLGTDNQLANAGEIRIEESDVPSSDFSSLIPPPSKAVYRQTVEVKRPVVEVKNPVPEVKNPVPEVKNPVPEVKNPVPEAKNPVAEVKKTNAEKETILILQPAVETTKERTREEGDVKKSNNGSEVEENQSIFSLPEIPAEESSAFKTIHEETKPQTLPQNLWRKPTFDKKPNESK